MDSLREKEGRLEDLLPLIEAQLAAGKAVRFSPKGTSMLPMLRQGIDSIVLTPLPGKLKKYDLPLYRRDNGHFVLHRIVKVEETYTCVGDNQFQLERGIRHDQMIGLVTEFYRGEKHYSVRSFRYRCYCRFWYYTRLIRRVWRKIFWFLKGKK